jgi:SAM-dependent methyltransferase
MPTSPNAIADSYDDEFFEPLSRIEPRHFWFVSRNRLILAMLRKFAPRLTSLLEVGCGTGFVLQGIREAFPTAHLYGSELFPGAFPFVRARVPSATLLQADARALPFEQEHDVVCAFDVVEHIEEDELVLRELARVTRPGGIVMLTVPQHRWLFSVADVAAHHKRRYTRNELLGKLRAAGLIPIRATSFVSLLLPAVVAARFSRSEAGYDPMSEFRIHPWVNRISQAMMTLERLIIRCGLSLPAGGSLLVVARRETGASGTIAG